MALLSIRNLSVEFHTEEGIVRAVDEVSFDIPRGKTVCLVGESGCGKSVSAYSLLGLVSPPGRVVGGEAILDGAAKQDLLKLSENELRSIIYCSDDDGRTWPQFSRFPDYSLFAGAPPAGIAWR